jgi:hypothetical protein
MYRLAFATLALSAAPAAVAQDAMTQLGAHVHGASTLAIAADPSTGVLTIEMEGPAYNLYGFERDPQSEEETALIARIAASVTDSSPFALTARAGCTWRNAEIIGGPGQSGDAHDHDAHDHGHDHGDDHEHDHDALGHDHDEGHDHGHDDDHDHGEHHDHGHDDGHDHHQDHDHGHAHDEPHGHDHDAEHTHSDVLVRWNFQCETVSALDRVDTALLFERLASLESLDAQFFDGARAAAGDLNREQTVFVID